MSAKKTLIIGVFYCGDIQPPEEESEPERENDGYRKCQRCDGNIPA